MTDDTQRELEQRALRNVRGLVDKIETSDELEARKQRKLLFWILGGLAVLAVVAAIVMAVRSSQGAKVAIDPAKLPPVKGGPQR